jgi:hypothetical protein
MTGEDEFQPGEVIRIALPDAHEDLQFLVSDVREDGGVATIKSDPRSRERRRDPAMGVARQRRS